MDRNRQIGKAQNTRQTSNFYVELTPYDTLFGFWPEYDRLQLEGKCLCATKIAAA